LSNITNQLGYWGVVHDVVTPFTSQVPPAVVSPQPNRIDAFWVASNGAVVGAAHEGFSSNGGWTPPYLFAPPGSAKSGTPVAAVSRSPNRFDVFWTSPNGAVVSTFWDALFNNGKLNAPFQIAAPGSAPSGAVLAATSRQANRIDVFWSNSSGTVMSVSWDAFANGWGAPFPISPSGSAESGGPIAAASRQPYRLDVFWTSPSGAVMTNWWDSFANHGNWNSAFPIAASGSARSGTQLSAVARHANEIQVFWTDGVGAVRTNWWDAFVNGGKWNTPFPISPHNANW
jgi:hypothetical protein